MRNAGRARQKPGLVRQPQLQASPRWFVSPASDSDQPEVPGAADHAPGSQQVVNRAADRLRGGVVGFGE